jgi:hypothetical protein
MFYDSTVVNDLAKKCYEAPLTFNGAKVWYAPEPGHTYDIGIDPGQAKITQTAISVKEWVVDDYGNPIPKFVARDYGLYPPEVTAQKATALSDYYNRATIAWEANGHGLALSELLKHRRPIYFRKDMISGRPSMEPGWLTTGGRRGTKDYMFQTMMKYLPSMITHDIEFVSQLRNFRISTDKVEVVGADDIHDSVAISLVCSPANTSNQPRGLIGTTGYRW